MKRISIALNIILIAGIVYMGCKTKDPIGPGGTDGNGDSSHCVTCNQPFHGVVANDFMEVVARYKTTHWDVINSQMSREISTNTEDSRCVWFSLERLKNFICNIERNSDLLKIDRESLGIRFYYAVYPGVQHGRFDGEYQTRLGQHTLYMVATTELNSEAVDFDPVLSVRHRRAGNDSIAYIANLLSDRNQELFMLSPDWKSAPAGSTSSSLIMNNGNLCPIHCPPNVLNTFTEVAKAFPGPVPYQ